MEAGRVRRAPGSGARWSSGVAAAGSVWESRMKLDEGTGGMRVFNGDDKEAGPGDMEEAGSSPGGSGDDVRRVRKSPICGSVKRKTWKSEINFEGLESVKSSPVQISKLRSDSQLHRSSSDSEKTPVQGRRKLRSERCKELGLSVSVDGEGNGSPIQGRRKLRSGDSNSVSGDVTVDGIDKDSTDQSKDSNGVDEPESNGYDGRDPVVEMVEKEEDESDLSCKALGVFEEKASSSNNVSQEQQEEDGGDGDEDKELEEGEFADMEEEEMELDEAEKETIDVKEINVPEPEEKPKKVVMIEVKKIAKLNIRPVAMASSVRTQPPPPSPVIRRSTIHQNHKPTKPIPSPAHDQHKRFPQTQNKLQSLVDLIMWRDVSRSAFLFGIGTFVIISSSYTQDLNISFISVISYVGLVYLAATFLYKSIICRGVIDTYDDDASNVVGEGEAVWLLKLFLPYLNEFLLKLRALFSGDPSTTMKLAVLLFVLARCGNFITIWKMAKFGFFGVFTVPKVCSSYSTHITAYGKFWIQRFRDAWESCTHKKSVAFAIFTLVWNLSSIVARVWAVFMLFVAIRYYQQSVMVRDDWAEDESDAVAGEETWQGQGQQSRGLGRHKHGPTIVELKKAKKGS